MNIEIISTFSSKDYTYYGQQFLLSLEKFLDETIDVTLYLDDCNIHHSNRFCRKYLNTIKDLTLFKQKHINYVPTAWHTDVVKFSHKSYVICDAVEKTNNDIIIWLDADTIALQNITKKYLLDKISNNHYCSLIDRPKCAETGFLAFNLNHNDTRKVIAEFKEYYDKDLIFQIPEQHDAYVFSHVVRQYAKTKDVFPFDLCSTVEIKKHHFNDIFENYFIHLKGKRKNNPIKYMKKALKNT